MTLTPEETRKRLMAIGWLTVVVAFAVGFTCGNVFFLLMSLV